MLKASNSRLKNILLFLNRPRPALDSFLLIPLFRPDNESDTDEEAIEDDDESSDDVSY